MTTQLDFIKDEYYFLRFNFQMINHYIFFILLLMSTNSATFDEELSIKMAGLSFETNFKYSNISLWANLK